MQPSIPFPIAPTPLSCFLLWLSRYNMVWNILLVHLVSSPCCVPFQDLTKTLPMMHCWKDRVDDMPVLLSISQNTGASSTLFQLPMQSWRKLLWENELQLIQMHFFHTTFFWLQLKEKLTNMSFTLNFSQKILIPHMNIPVFLHSLLQYHDQLPTWRRRFDNGHNRFSFSWIFSSITLILRVLQKMFLSVYKSWKQSNILMGKKRRKSRFFESYFSWICEILKCIYESQVREKS